MVLVPQGAGSSREENFMTDTQVEWVSTTSAFWCSHPVALYQGNIAYLQVKQFLEAAKTTRPSSAFSKQICSAHFLAKFLADQHDMMLS